MRAFLTPQTSLGDLDAASAATLIAAAADIALIVDGAGVIRDVAIHSDELSAELPDSAGWAGQKLTATVVADSRAKVETLLRTAGSAEAARWRHVNHAGPGGASVPVLYNAVRVGEDGRVVAFGRDLRAISALQQRLVNAQQSMERDYSRFRDVELRYRLLFQMSSEAVLILETGRMKVQEANPAARHMFGAAGEHLVGQTLSGIFAAESVSVVQAHLGAVRAGGRGDEMRALLADGATEVVAAASLFRQDSTTLFLMRISPVQGHAGPAIPDIRSKLLQVVDNAPDGFVLTDQSGQILTANAAFLEMAQLHNEEQAQGESLDRWLGESAVDLNVLISNLRQRGAIRFFATTLRGELGAAAQVEISAVSVANGGQPCFGLAIRNVGARLRAEPKGKRELPRSVEQLTELIGRVALKDLVREATDVIERLCIEAALELTNDNRASAAEMLGLSRQSLYVKLRRHGLGDLGPESNE